MSVRLYFFRHGQSEANLTNNRICGQSNHSPLTRLGNEQSKLLGKRCSYENITFDYTLCSSAIRAIQTANIVLETMNLDPSKLITSPALLEQSQGHWEGADRMLIHTPEIKEQKETMHIEFCPPDGESLQMVKQRAIDYLEPFIEQAKKQSTLENREISIAIFTHAGLVRVVLLYYLQIHPQYLGLIRQSNTAITEILIDQKGFSLVKLNDHGHLTLLIPERDIDINEQKN